MVLGSQGPSSYCIEGENVNKHIYTSLHVIVLIQKSMGSARGCSKSGP